MEADKLRRIAKALDISVYELDRLTWHLNSSKDGQGRIYARRIEFTEPIPPEIAVKIAGLKANEVPTDRGVLAFAFYD